MNKNKMNEQQNQNAEILTLSDSELQYIIENYENLDQASVIDQILTVYKRNQFIFLFILILEMSLSCFLLFITWQKKENSILVMQEIYKDLNGFEASILFHTIFFITLVLNSVLYPMGYYALISKKIKILKWFSTLTLYSGVMTIFIIYINM